MKNDKERMLSVFEAFETLGAPEQRRYQIARRMSMVGSLPHMALLGAAQLEKVDSYLSQLETEAH